MARRPTGTNRREIDLRMLQLEWAAASCIDQRDAKLILSEVLLLKEAVARHLLGGHQGNTDPSA